MPGAEIVFQVWESPEGGYEASAVGHDIFTEGDDWEHLEFMLRDAVLCHFDDYELPQSIRVHVVQSEVIPVKEDLHNRHSREGGNPSAGYIESREKSKVRPEVMAHFRASLERNRHLGELLAKS